MAKGNAPVQARAVSEEARPARVSSADKRTLADEQSLSTLLGFFGQDPNLVEVTVTDGRATAILAEADEDMMWPDRINDVPVTFEVRAVDA